MKGDLIVCARKYPIPVLWKHHTFVQSLHHYQQWLRQCKKNDDNNHLIMHMPFELCSFANKRSKKLY